MGRGPVEDAASGCGTSSPLWVAFTSAVDGDGSGMGGGVGRSRRWIAFSTSMYNVLSSCLCARALGGWLTAGCGGAAGGVTPGGEASVALSWPGTRCSCADPCKGHPADPFCSHLGSRIDTCSFAFRRRIFPLFNEAKPRRELRNRSLSLELSLAGGLPRKLTQQSTSNS